MVTRWMRLSVDYFTDDKIAQLTPAQQVLYLKLITWSVKHETDGRIPWPALRTIGQGMRNVTASLNLFETLMLLGCDKDSAGIVQAYDIVAFGKWQMVTTDARPKPAGQSAAPRTHARTPARTKNRTELDIDLSDDPLAPVTEVVNPRLRAVLDRVGKQMAGKQGECNGSA